MQIVARSRSLQTKLSLCLIAINLVLVIFSAHHIDDAVKTNKRADRIAAVNICSDAFLSAIRALAFERGRTNVVLSAETPISDENRAFIEVRRVQIDANLRIGLEQLSAIDPESAARLQSHYAEFLKLRAKATPQTELKYAAREQNVSEEWLSNCTAFILQIENTLELLGTTELSFDRYTSYFHYQLNCVAFRLFSGYSASILTAAIGRGILPLEKHHEFLESRAKADYIWTSIDRDISQLKNTALLSKKNSLYHEYYEVYRPLQDEVLRQALAGNVPADSGPRLAALSVPPFESIFDLIDEVSAENRRYIAEMKAEAVKSLQMAVFRLFLVLVLITFTIAYFRSVLFSPMRRIINALQNIANGQPAADLEAIAQRQDEIGWLAQGVELLQMSMEQEQQTKARLELLATTDSLTGLYNRQMLDQEVERALAQADRYHEPIALITFDLDHFKRVNDTWGHPVGDQVLKQTAQVVVKLIRKSDRFFRIGGEEFLILLPQTNAEEAVIAAEKIRLALEATNHLQAGQVTVSIGVTERHRKESFTSFFKRADDNLYRAKEYGRNRVVSSTIPLVHMLWDSEWESGHAVIDSQHQHLLERMQELFELAILSKAGHRQELPVLDKLFEEITAHFAFEEQVLEEIGYSGIEDHRLAHRQLCNQAECFKESYIQGMLDVSSFVSFIMEEVVLGHMLKEDVLFYPYTQKKMGY